MCAMAGHIPKNNNEFALKWVVRGDQELPSVITRGVLWHYEGVVSKTSSGQPSLGASYGE